MRALVCVSEYYPSGSGIANVAYHLVERLKKRGVECTVCSPTGPDLKIDTIPNCGRLTLALFWLKVSRRLKKNADQYDVVWLHNPLFVTGNPFRNCLITIHTTPLGRITRRVHSYPTYAYELFATLFDRFCYALLDQEDARILTVSPSVEKELARLGVGGAQIIPNGVDTNRFRPAADKARLRKELGIPVDSTVFLSVGRLTSVKRPRALIDTFSKVKKRVPNAYLVLAGDGDLHDDIARHLQEKDIRDVRLLGQMKQTDLPQVYASADYYIMASKYEGLPLTLLEAMSSGLPCIVSDIPGLSIVAEAGCGIMLDFGDTDAASEAIIRYLQQDRSVPADKARQYAIKKNDWDTIADQYLGMMRQVSVRGRDGTAGPS